MYERPPAHPEHHTDPSSPGPWPDVRGFVLGGAQGPQEPAPGHSASQAAPGTIMPRFEPLQGAAPQPYALQHQQPVSQHHARPATQAQPPFGHHVPAQAQAQAHAATHAPQQFTAGSGWGYPTPGGMVALQGAPMSAAAAAAPAQSPAVVLSSIAATPVPLPPALRRRMRWETIVPIAAAICFLVAVGAFVADFDQITGRDTGGASSNSSSAPATAPVTNDTPATDQTPLIDPAATTDPGTTSASPAQLQREATRLLQLGRFDEAANVLAPALAAASPAPALVQLHTRITTAGARNTALLAQLTRQRSAGNWSAVVRTLGQLETLRPLSADLTKLRATARAKAAAATGGGSSSHATHSHAAPPAAAGTDHAATHATPPAVAPSGGSMPGMPDMPGMSSGTPPAGGSVA